MEGFFQVEHCSPIKLKRIKRCFVRLTSWFSVWSFPPACPRVSCCVSWLFSITVDSCFLFLLSLESGIRLQTRPGSAEGAAGVPAGTGVGKLSGSFVWSDLVEFHVVHTGALCAAFPCALLHWWSDSNAVSVSEVFPGSLIGAVIPLRRP